MKIAHHIWSAISFSGVQNMRLMLWSVYVSYEYLADILSDWMLGNLHSIPVAAPRVHTLEKPWLTDRTVNRWRERAKMLSIRSYSFFSLWENSFLKSAKDLEDNVKPFKADISFSVGSQSREKWRYCTLLV